MANIINMKLPSKGLTNSLTVAEIAAPAMPTDVINIRSQMGNISQISLSEGQKRVQPSRVKAVEGPDLQGEVLSANAEAYNRDAAIFR